MTNSKCSWLASLQSAHDMTYYICKAWNGSFFINTNDEFTKIAKQEGNCHLFTILITELLKHHVSWSCKNQAVSRFFRSGSLNIKFHDLSRFPWPVRTRFHIVMKFFIWNRRGSHFAVNTQSRTSPSTQLNWVDNYAVANDIDWSNNKQWPQQQFFK